MNNTTINLAYWNANAVFNKKDELAVFCEENKIDIMLINETHLKPQKQFNIRNYTTYRTDRKESKGGGTAILVKKGIKHGELPSCKQENIESTGILLQTKNGNFNIYSVYKAPNKEMLETDIQAMFMDNKATIAAGDFNAKHINWNSRITNTNGRKLQDIANKHNLLIKGPTEATHICTNTASSDVLDILLMKNVAHRVEIKTTADLSSDHNPVMVELFIEKDSYTREIKRTNWTKFRNEMETKTLNIGNETELNEAVIDLERRIKDAEQAATTTIKENKKNVLPASIKLLLETKRKAKKKYIKTLHPDDKRELNRLTNEVKMEIRSYNNEKWNDKLETLTTEDNSLWQMAAALAGKRSKRQIPCLQKNDKQLITDQDKADGFAEMLAEQFSPNGNTGDAMFVKNINNIGSRIATCEEDFQEEEITKEEISNIIKDLKSRKAPGIDGIKNQALKNLPSQAIEEIKDIANGILRIQKFPQVWKKAQTIMLHKHGKTKKDISSYRPISLLPAISKIIERTLYKRMLQHVEKQKVIPDFQFGFRKEHSTVHQLARITEDITGNMNISKSTGAIFLDVEKAFDKVWHEALIYKMKKERFSTQMINIIQSYLHGRTFNVKVEDCTSHTGKVLAGVPQGSVIGPLLYNIYTSDMPKLKFAKVAQFADDTAIYVHGKTKREVHRQLQADITTLEGYYKKWRIKINAEKSTAVLFDPKRRIRTPEEVCLNGLNIPWKKEAKYLGVTLDKNLTYGKQVVNNIKKIKQLAGCLYPLLNQGSKMSLDNKVRIIKAIIMPSVTYAGEIWHTRSNKKDKLQTAVNVITRRAMGAPWYITNEQIRRETGMETLEEKISRQASNTMDRMIEHSNTEINRIANTKIRKTDKRETLLQWKRAYEDSEEHSTKKAKLRR